MIQITRITDALPVLTFDLSLSSQPVTLDSRSQEWIRDLALKATKKRYILHPDFLPGYQEGYGLYLQEEHGYETIEHLVLDIELSLSHKHYHKNVGYAVARGESYLSYEWQVGSFFGWVTAFLQTPDAATDFPFLLAPVASLHSLLASHSFSIV